MDLKMAIRSANSCIQQMARNVVALTRQVRGVTADAVGSWACFDQFSMIGTSD